MIIIPKAFSSCGDDFDEIESKNVNHEFIKDYNSLTDNNNYSNRKDTLNSTEYSSTEKSNIESYLLGDQVVTKEIKDSKNFVSKSSLVKKNEIRKKDKFFETPSLLIQEIIVDNKLYAVYQELINYTFFVKSFSLKEIKNPTNFINGIREVNKPYLDKRVPDLSYYFIFKGYLPSLRGNPPNYLYNVK